MCINIWQNFHLLHLFSIGLMYEASVLKTFEWKLQKRAEREKGCRKGWAVGRTAGKPEDWSLARAGGFGRETRGQSTKRQDEVHMQQASGIGSLLSWPSFFLFSFSSTPTSGSRWVQGEKMVRRWKFSQFFSPTSGLGRREISLPVPMYLILMGVREQGFSSASTWN